MNRPLTRRAGPLVAVTAGLLLGAAGAVPRAQNVAAPPPVPWPTPPLPDGGDRFPEWKRNAFVGGLREGEVPRSGQVQRVVFNEKWEEIRREPLLRELKQRIRDVRQGPDGLLYVLTGESPGAVLRLEPVQATATR